MTALLLPLLSFIFLSLVGKKLNKAIVPLIACGSIFIPFLIFAYLSFTNPPDENIFIYRWIEAPGVKADFSLHLDHLSLLMTLIITGVGFLIHVYSIGYMEDELSQVRYFAYMNLFIFSMLLLVCASDLTLLFIGWEGVGLASYLLIGYYYEKPTAASAATKAFVVNRIGDFGFILGIALCFVLFGTTDIATINNSNSSYASLITSLLLCGAIAKSAQIPLHVWLPDAMEGPTPVSALIHAATMVTAGVYLVARLHLLFLQAPVVLFWIGVIGAITALAAALSALGQTDLKRVLAYSTISQLGLMFLACGVGAFYAAMFHLTTHAFMKALLFLSAGNVIHKLHGVTEMGEMGGLAKPFKQTHWLFLIGALAMSGIPPLAAFFSKDLILEVEYTAGDLNLFWTAVATSILTAVYLIRAYLLTFRGEEKQHHAHAEEAPEVMLIPVKILAVLAILGGFLGFINGPRPLLEGYLSELGITPAEKEFTEHFWTSEGTWLSILMAVVGVALGVLAYRKHLKSYSLLKRGFYFDEIYRYCFVKPYGWIAKVIAEGFEPHFFTELIRITPVTALKSAEVLQKIQSGQIRSYAAWMVIGGVCMLIYLVT